MAGHSSGVVSGKSTFNNKNMGPYSLLLIWMSVVAIIIMLPSCSKVQYIQLLHIFTPHHS
jgi:hypothetical protein